MAGEQVLPQVQEVLDNYGISYEEYQQWLETGAVPQGLTLGLEMTGGAVEAAATMEEIAQFVREKEAQAGIASQEPNVQETVESEAQRRVEAERQAEQVLADLSSYRPDSEEYEAAAVEAAELQENPQLLSPELQEALANFTTLEVMDTTVLQQVVNRNGWQHQVTDSNMVFLMLDGLNAAWAKWKDDPPPDARGLWDLVPGNEPPGQDYDQWAATKFYEWYVSNQEEGSLQAQLSDTWGRAREYKPPPWTIGNGKYDGYEISEIAEHLQISSEQAARVADLMAESGLDMEEGLLLWQFGRDNGLVHDIRANDSILDWSYRPPRYEGTDHEKAAREGEIAAGEYSDQAAPSQVEVAPGIFMPTGPQEAPQPAYQEYQFDPEAGQDLPYGPMSIASFGRKFSENKQEFKTLIPTYVSMLDPAMARRLMDDPYSLSFDEHLKIMEWIGDDPVFKTHVMNSPMGAVQWNWLEGMGGDNTRMESIDKEAVREATRTLISSWNLPGMSDAFVDSVANSFAAGQKVMAQQALGNPFNPQYSGTVDTILVDEPSDRTAHAKKRVRETGEYQKYFTNKGDLSEEEYVNRFESVSQNMFGQSNKDSVRAGMIGGERKDVAAHGIASGEFKESSTFQGRLARLVDAFRSET